MAIDWFSNIAVVYCDGIMCREEAVLSLPAGWTGSTESGGEGRSVFCSKPACQLQREWFVSQCPGCVGSYSNCALGRSFRYSGRRTITPEQIGVIRSGRCPVRIGGMIETRVTAAGSRVEVDGDLLPACDVVGAGDAVADAIEAHIAEFPTVAG